MTLAASGFGSKRCDITLDESANSPHQFRLMAEHMYGYVWPKWSRAGETASLRVHSPEPYRLSLVRCGREVEHEVLLGWFDEHGPRATVQTLPDGDFSQAGVGWRETGRVVAPSESGLYYFYAEGENGGFFSFPWVVAPAAPASQLAVVASTNTWHAYNNFGGRSNYINAATLPACPTVVAHLDLPRYLHGTPIEHSYPDSRVRAAVVRATRTPESNYPLRAPDGPHSWSSALSPRRGRVAVVQLAGARALPL